MRCPRADVHVRSKLPSVWRFVIMPVQHQVSEGAIMLRRPAIAIGLVCLITGCDLAEPTRESSANSVLPASLLLQDQYAVDFRAFVENEDLTVSGWTPFVRFADIPRYGDWRARTVPGSLTGIAAVLTDPPVSSSDRRALRWDQTASATAPIEILAHLWVPPDS